MRWRFTACPDTRIPDRPGFCQGYGEVRTSLRPRVVVRPDRSLIMADMRRTPAAARLLPIVLLSAVSMHALAQAPPAEKPVHFGTWGVDLAALDRTAKPGEDFDLYVNGGWKRKTEIPADQPSTGVGYDVFNRSQAQIRAIIDQAPADQPARRHVSQLHERSRGRGARRQAAAGGPEARRRARRQGRLRDVHGRDERRASASRWSAPASDRIRSTRR